MTSDSLHLVKSGRDGLMDSVIHHLIIYLVRWIWTKSTFTFMHSSRVAADE